jgi:hypothetical protein
LHCDGIGNGNVRGFGEIVVLVGMVEDYKRKSHVSERERERESEAKGNYRRICGVVWCGVRVMVWEYQVFGIWGYHI